MRVGISAACVPLMSCTSATEASVTVPPKPPAPISVSVSAAAPYHTVVLTLASGAVTTDRLGGTLGSTALTGARLSDSTLSVIVPSMTAGTYPLTITSGITDFATTFQVLAPDPVPNPVASLDSVVHSLTALMDAQESALADPLLFSGTDSVAIRREIASERAQLVSFQSDLGALTTADKAQVVAFLAANQPRIAASASLDASMYATQASGAGVCQDGQRCYDVVDILLHGVAVGASAWVATIYAVQVVGWITTPAGAAALKGASIVAAIAVTGYAVAEMALLAGRAIRLRSAVLARGGSVSPSVASAGSPQSAPSPVRSTQALAGASTMQSFVNGVPSALVVSAEYASLTSADLVSDPHAAGIVRSLAELTRAWTALARAVPFFSLPAPTFPATPLVTVTRPVPPTQLQLGAISPASFAGSATVNGAAWLVTFTNSAQGADHTLNVTATVTPAGLSPENVMGTVLLRPAQYAVMTLGIRETSPSVLVGSTLTLTAVIQDSSARDLTAADLVGRSPTWSSSSLGVATVGPTTGVVTGLSPGSANISVAAGGKTAQVPVNVVVPLIPDSTAIYRSSLAGATLNVHYASAQPASYTLKLNADGTGVYGIPNQPGAWGMSWSIIRNGGRYYFVDSGFWNGWSPTSLLSYPPTSFSTSSFGDVLSYSR